MTTMRDASRNSWTGNNTTEHINAGSLQRIADATEKMAGSYANLITERDRYKAAHDREVAARQYADRRITALRGVITRLKRRH
jgi:hypothetical protein